MTARLRQILTLAAVVALNTLFGAAGVVVGTPPATAATDQDSRGTAEFSYDSPFTATSLPANPRSDAPRGEWLLASGMWSSTSPIAANRATKGAPR